MQHEWFSKYPITAFENNLAPQYYESKIASMETEITALMAKSELLFEATRAIISQAEGERHIQFCVTRCMSLETRWGGSVLVHVKECVARKDPALVKSIRNCCEKFLKHEGWNGSYWDTVVKSFCQLEDLKAELEQMKKQHQYHLQTVQEFGLDKPIDTSNDPGIGEEVNGSPFPTLPFVPCLPRCFGPAPARIRF